MSEKTLPAVTLTGEPFERGQIHGETFSAEVRENVERYLSLFAHYGTDRDEVLEEAIKYLEVIDEHNEAYGDEIRGIAEGSDLPVPQIALLNARYEVVYSAYRDEAEDETVSGETAGEGARYTDGCTSFGVRPDVTADGRAYIGENWDWNVGVADQVVVTRVRGTDGLNHVAITEAGIVGGKMGVNEAGIGLAVNGLVTPTDGKTPYRKPFHVRCREVLSTDRFANAIGAVIDTDRTCSGNFVLGHREGEILNLETAPETVNYRYPEAGILTHANHFEGDAAESTLERIIPHSLVRGPRLRRLLATERGAIDVDIIKRTLRDHFDKPSSICHHADPKTAPIEREQTNVSVIADLEERTLHATAGPPCEHTYETYHCPT